MSEKTYTSNMSSQLDYSNWNQFVLTRTNMTDPFTDDEYNSCIEALTKHNAVAVSFGTGSIQQAQLVFKTNAGILRFSCTRNEKVETWSVAAASPHNITAESYDVNNSISLTYNTGTKIGDIVLNGVFSELFIPVQSPFYYVDTTSDTRATIQAAFGDGLLPIIIKTNPAGLRQVFHFTHGDPTAGYSFAYTDSTGTNGWTIDQYDAWSEFNI